MRYFLWNLKKFDMNNLDRLCILLNEFIFFEESRLLDDCESSFYLLRTHKNDIHYVLKYIAAVQRLDDFREFSRKVIELMNYFQ